ncbi:Fe-containing alcohol dehydrogenase [Blumeria hordei DH14]|uniref:hydroxyacid-oxoacid transhydrogenase n=1 Tax=Blumeria graminis f. sp. hordei (strain DH14) TaxID=546991 RepID=N1JK39_BLUG1|nr:Fe-containing alcohol dehydrogenase [Blumeria hordei DH14]
MVSAIRVAPSRANKAVNLLRTFQYTYPPTCPCHGSPSSSHQNQPSKALQTHTKRNLQFRSSNTIGTSEQKEYAFEMASSSVRFGAGATKEVGMDLENLGANRVCVVTDKTVRNLYGMQQAIQSLERSEITYFIYDGCRVEPKQSSILKAIEFARISQPDAFLAVGGGSVIDTAKLMNLLTCYPDATLMDFVNQPLGKGQPISKTLKPLIAIPTTAGTGSETTGTAIFDIDSLRTKTGVSHRNLKPILGICDPLNTRTMPAAVHASSGLDVLCHSLESWTAIPYNERKPRPTNPINRPAYQGANPISDIFSLQALRNTIKYLPRAKNDPEDYEAQSEMLLAATLAGVGFGNAGVHLCHGMSYPISGLNPGYKHPGYATDLPLIPHGVSVAVTAPAVFRFTGASNPERHLKAAECFGVDISNVKRESAGAVLAEALSKFLQDLGDQPSGLRGLGFGREHLDSLVAGAMPQQRVLKLAPGLQEELSEQTEQLQSLFEDAM